MSLDSDNLPISRVECTQLLAELERLTPSHPRHTSCITTHPMPCIHPLFLSPSSRVLRGYRAVSSILDDIDVIWSSPKPLLFDTDETETAYTFTCVLPGFKKDEVSVEVREGAYLSEFLYLSIVAAKGSAKGVQTRTNDGVVNATNCLSRTITLPSDADSTKVEAKLEDGLLTLTVAKLVAAQPRKVTIS